MTRFSLVVGLPRTLQRDWEGSKNTGNSDGSIDERGYESMILLLKLFKVTKQIYKIGIYLFSKPQLQSPSDILCVGTIRIHNVVNEFLPRSLSFLRLVRGDIESS